MTVDFITSVYSGNIHKVYSGNQLRKQVESNKYDFNEIFVIHQKVPPLNNVGFGLNVVTPHIKNDIDINGILIKFGIDLTKPQYLSPDKGHIWKYHVVNHALGAMMSNADYIVFADADCWMKEPINWVDLAIKTFEDNTDCFIVSPNDGEPKRCTLRMSQQMFMCRREQFLAANWNQPGYTGNPRDYDTMPEYHAMLEGRMEYHCWQARKFRYVLDSQYRYWHHNRNDKEGMFETDYSKY